MSNIFEPISNDAYKQIEVRQTKISGSFRDNETIAWLNSNGAFVRLKSSIDITDEKLRENIGEIGDQPFELASRYTLQGGIKGGFTFGDKTSIQTEDGIETGYIGNSRDLSSKSGILGSEFAPAYGFEGTSITGLKPMPGIEKVSIKTVGEGYLREATINLRANSPEQLNILDVLYFRPGYSVLLEWGHTAYFTNDEIFEKNPYKEISLANKNKSQILKEIEENREESSYNYDAMFGVIENFQWNFRDDGGYDVTLKLISTGDIVDSLKISGVSNSSSTPLDSKTKEDQNIPPFIKEYNKSSLHKNLIPLLYSENKKYYSVKNKETYDIQDETAGIELDYFWAWLKKKYTYRNFKISSYKEIDLNFSNSVENIPTFNQIIFIGKPDEKISSDANLGTQRKELKSNCYIKFGAFLDLLNNLFFIKNFHRIENPTQGSIDMYVPKFCISTNPEVCIIDSFAFEDFSNALYLNENNSGQISGNLLRVLYPSQFIFFQGNNSHIGNLLELFINVEFVLSTFEQNLDSEGNLNAGNYLKSILNSINSSTGNVNNFKVIENNSKGTLEIISLFNDPYKENFNILNDRKLETFGNKTLFTSINLTSELTDDISSQIAISAQVTNTDTNGEKGDIFSYFNQGIIDRIIPKKVTREEEEEEITPTKEEVRRNNAKTFLDYIISIYPTKLEEGSPNPSLSPGTAQRYLKEFLNYSEQKNPKTRGTSVLIPVNLSFTMQGFSGFKLFNEFIIPTDFLPNLYKSSNGVDPKFKFLVKGINHDISLNKWDTSIETFMAPIPEKSDYRDEEEKPLFKPLPPPPPPVDTEKLLKERKLTPFIVSGETIAFREVINTLPNGKDLLGDDWYDVDGNILSEEERKQLFEEYGLR